MNKFTTDNEGFICQTNGDFGDCCNRMGMYWTLVWIWHHFLDQPIPDELKIKGDPEFHFSKLEVEPGVYVRYFKEQQGQSFVTDPSRFSRDQQTPLVIAMGLWGLTERLDRLWKKQDSRFLNKYQNADYPSPEHWNFYHRAFGNSERNYFLGDSFMLLNSILQCQKTAKDPNDVDINNHLLALVQAELLYHTNTSNLATDYFRKNYPRNMGNTELGIRDNILGAIHWYHRPDSGANQGFIDLWRPVIKVLIGPRPD